MPRLKSHSVLAGTAVPHASAKVIGPADPSAFRRVTVVLQSRMPAAERKARIARFATQLPHQREYLKPREFAGLCGADPDHLKAVERFAKANGLRVESSSAILRNVVITGSTEEFSKVFQLVMEEYAQKHGHYTSHSGPIYVPKELSPIIESILGLDDQPLKREVVMLPKGRTGFMTPAQVAEAYSFPPDTDGDGQKVGIVLPGCGMEMDSVRYHFQHAGLAMPQVKLMEILGGTSQAASREDVALVLSVLDGKTTLTKDTVPVFSRGMNTIESNMDVIVAGSFAPKALILVYAAPDSHQGAFHALAHATTDPGHPAVISCSWSSLETAYAPAVIKTMNTVFQLAALQGTTICFSSGDDGDGTLWNLAKTPTVHYPASSPYVLACGGTSLRAVRKAFTEVSWNEKSGSMRMASGGGYSVLNPRQSWQKHASPGNGGRGVPDVAGKADVRGGYEMDASGLTFTMGGTSAATPMWAALATRLNQALGVKVGMLGPLLYDKRFRGAFREILTSDNGAYKAGPGWNPVTGLGSPNGAALLQALRGD